MNNNICNKCGQANDASSKFCIKCGNSLVQVQSEVAVENNTIEPVQNAQSVTDEQAITPVQPVQNMQQQEVVSNIQPNIVQTQAHTTTVSVNRTSVENASVSFMGYFFIILSIILKPFTAFKEELNKFNTFKNSTMISLIVSGIATVINLLTSMWNAIHSKSFDWTSGGYSTSWNWDKLGDLNYIQIIGKNFLIYAGAILVVAGIYYLASLIAKKQTKFPRLLGISALSVTPLLISYLVLSPLLTLIYAPLGIFITIAGAVYTIVLIYEGMNSELQLEGNIKYYINLICLTILGVALYYVYINLMVSSITDGLGDLMDLFN